MFHDRSYDQEDFEQIQYPPELPSLMRSASRSAQTLDARKQCTQLTTTTFEHMFDSDGRLVDEHRLRRAVFSGRLSMVGVTTTCSFFHVLLHNLS